MRLKTRAERENDTLGDVVTVVSPAIPIDELIVDCAAELTPSPYQKSGRGAISTRSSARSSPDEARTPSSTRTSVRAAGARENDASRNDGEPSTTHRRRW
jgi:hypothetical protein